MEALTGDLAIDIILLITGLGTGGVAVALIEWLRNSRIKEREIYIDISKTKISSVSKSLPYYGQIVGHSYELNNEISQESKDYDLILYHLCCILGFKDQCFRKYGPIQLDNVDAEYTIERLGRGIEYFLKNRIGSVELSILKSLIKDDSHFHTFKEHIANNRNTIPNISSMLSSNDFVIELGKITRYYRELIILEINHVYRTWYTEETRVPLISKDTEDHLLRNHLIYWARLQSLYECGSAIPTEGSY